MNATACVSSSLPSPSLRPKKLQSVLAVFEATIDQNAVRGDCNSKFFLGNFAATKSQRRSSLDSSRDSGCAPAQIETPSKANPVIKAVIQPYQRRASVGSTPIAIGGAEKAPFGTAPSPTNENEKCTKEDDVAVLPMNGATSALVAALDNPVLSNNVSCSAESPFDISGFTTASSSDESEASLDNLWDFAESEEPVATAEPEPTSHRRRCVRRVGSSATVEFHDSTDNMHADYFLASFEEQKRLARLRSIPQRTKSKSLAQARPVAERMQAFSTAI
jgi:hypothetical protein